MAQERPSAVGVASLLVRVKPSFLAKGVAKFSYGKNVKVVAVRGDWSRISRGSVVGWVPTTSLGERGSILRDLARSSAESSATYKDEVATAGKGFSAEYEKMLREQNTKLDFEKVNQIESIEIPTRGLIQFQTKGRLKSEILR